MTSTKRDLARFRDKHSRLQGFIEQGGQKKHVVYRCKDSDKVFCAKCANELESLAISTIPYKRYIFVLDGGGIYQQGPTIECQMCKKELLSVKG
jgi:hypothetical protein